MEEPTSKSVTIKEDPQPSTSKDEEISELAPPSKSPFWKHDCLTSKLILGEYSLFQKSVHWLVFIWAFIESGMISLTHFLNRYSRDYRYVLKTLGKERKMLKVRFSLKFLSKHFIGVHFRKTLNTTWVSGWVRTNFGILPGLSMIWCDNQRKFLIQ